MEKLSPKQELFIKEYLVDLNGTQAAIRAGYSEKTANEQASRLLANVSIKELVQQKMDERSERVEITADYVLGTLKEVVERCLEREPVMVRRGRNMVQAIDADGNHIWKFDASGANTALHLLGKHLKLFTEKLQLEGNPDKPIAITAIPLEDRIKIAKGETGSED